MRRSRQQSSNRATRRLLTKGRDEETEQMMRKFEEDQRKVNPNRTDFRGVKCAAISQGEEIYIGIHHAAIIQKIYQKTQEYVDGEQGFVDYDGNFLDRKEAMELAINCGQVQQRDMAMPRIGLDSSDLY